MPFANQHPLYSVWAGMRARCNNPHLKSYVNYGGRGICVCERWLGPTGFASFVEDMGHRPPDYTIERRDNDGNYEPGNCYWATRKEQQRNRRGTIRLLIEGKSYLLAELVELTGLKPDTVKLRYSKGWNYEEIISPERKWDTRGFALGAEANRARKLANTHCKNGHEFTETNTLLSKEGWRYCRACHAERERARRSA